MYASKTQRCIGAVEGLSLGAAGGGAGLVQAHGFAQPAGKVHLLHFGSLDICVTLKGNERESIIYITSIIKPK